VCLYASLFCLVYRHLARELDGEDDDGDSDSGDESLALRFLVVCFLVAWSLVPAFMALAMPQSRMRGARARDGPVQVVVVVVLFSRGLPGEC
jgi:hypothetical protein